MATAVRIGTCSFADEALVRYWYPRGTRDGEERLRRYAEVFSTVEIDSTFYRLPDPELTARWAERVPPGFVFHVKAFAPLTRHPVRLEQLPPDLREGIAVDGRGRVERVPTEVRREIAARFAAALDPLRAAGVLGGVLVQLPPYVVPKPTSLAYLDWLRAQLPLERLLVEFRHRAWLEGPQTAQTLSFLEERGLVHVAVDAPRTSARNVVPTVVARTAPTAYVRMHGRNAATWNRRGGGAAERFDHLYEPEELAEWVEPLQSLAAEAEEAYVLFNTNNRSPRPAFPELADEPVGGRVEDGVRLVAQGPANALLLRRLLRDAGVPSG